MQKDKGEVEDPEGIEMLVNVRIESGECVNWWKRGEGIKRGIM